MTYRYSLSDYIVAVQIPDSLRDVFAGNTSTAFDENANMITLGGDGSHTGSITISRETDQWSTDGDPTGSWVHNQNKDKHGSVSVEINQVDDRVRLLMRLYETYYSADSNTDGLTLTVYKAINSTNSKTIAVCTDCYLQNSPDLAYGESAANQEWQFTCGRIDMNGEAL